MPQLHVLQRNMRILSIITISLLLICPLVARSPGPMPEPELPLEKALELAKEYVRENKIDLSNHYMDRVWIGYQEGQPDRRWIISWSPKPEKLKEAKGWIILKVKLDGTVTDEAGGVPWLDPRIFTDSTVAPVKKNEEAEQAAPRNR